MQLCHVEFHKTNTDIHASFLESPDCMIATKLRNQIRKLQVWHWNEGMHFGDFCHFLHCTWSCHRGYYSDAANEPLIRCVKFRVAHAPGMPGTSSPPPRLSDPDMHHGTCVTHVPWCMPRSLTSCFLLIRWRGKRSRHSRRIRNP